jgi:MFS family permease
VTAADAPAQRRLTALVAATLVLGLAGSMTFQALIPLFIPLWGLSHGAAGWLAGAGFGAAAVTAPVAVTLTDRLDARQVVLAGLVLSALAGIGFALLADGFWSAFAWRLIGGIGMALVYMPGLKALTDRTHGPEQGRLQSIYTAFYSVGIALSLAVAGVAASWFGWRGAFVASGLLSAFGLALMAIGVEPHRPPGEPPPLRGLFDFRPVLREPRIMRFILGYGGHCFELFGFRSWLVAFLTFAAARSGSDATPETLALLGTGLVLLGLPASIFGNELASRSDRGGVLTAVMLASAATGAVLGFLAGLPFLLLAVLTAFYAVVMMADSAALTVGTIAVADPARRGATIAVQQLCGSSAAVLAPLLVGLLLDSLGADGLVGWGVAFMLLGGGALAGAAALAFYGRSAAASSRLTSSQPK